MHRRFSCFYCTVTANEVWTLGEMTAFLSATLICVALVAATDAASCPSDWVAFKNSCYAFLDIKVPWSAAKTICDTLGGKVLEVESREENDFVAARLRSQRKDKAWLAVHDFFREGQWLLTSNGRPVTYTNWNSGQPNDSKNYEGGEDCAYIRSAGRWQDLWCEKDLYTPTTVCEKSNTPVPQEVPLGGSKS